MKGPPAASPDAYVEALSGWQRDRVTMLRAAINAGAPFDEIIKWHNLIFVSNGLCILIHTEESRILLGFWRGKRLATLDARIKPSGKYELGNITLVEDRTIDPADVTRLATAAAMLNAELGNPTARH
ncbi:MAG TPA: DUF1801 domain-containing protein [Sphingomicrobium sp.]|nr:DUF1801 domain-containing protein [Sphingomicrobium sp.]